MENPYQAPPQTTAYRSRSSPVSTHVITPLEKTKLWARIISILGFTLGGLNTLIIFGGIAHGRMGFQIILQFLICGAIFYFSFLAGQYANRLSRISRSQSESDLAAALKTQHAIWRLMGMLWVVGGIFVVMVFVLGIANIFA